MEKKTKFAVLGCGNGGMAIAGYIASEGYSVNLYEDPKFKENINPIKESGGIRLKGEIDDFGTISLATTDIKEAVDGVDVIMVVTPASVHKKLAKSALPYLESNQIVILNPGRTGGALEWFKLAKTMDKDLIVGETQSLIYACRKKGPTAVEIKGTKDELLVGVIPATYTEKAIEKIKALYPQFKPAENVLVTSLGNIGAVFHPTISLFSTGCMEFSQKFDFYTQGTTEAVSRALERIDEERVSVCEEIGIKHFSAKEWLRRAYGIKASNLHNAIKSNAVYEGIKAPSSPNNRYFTEDVPTGLVPISSIGNHFGVNTPLTDSLINLSSSLLDRDFWEEGRTINSLNLNKVNKNELKQYLRNGGY